MFFVTTVSAEDWSALDLNGDCLKAANAKPSPNKVSGIVPFVTKRKTNHVIIEGEAR